MIIIGLCLVYFVQMAVFLWCYHQFIPLRFGKLVYVIYPSFILLTSAVLAVVLGVGMWDLSLVKTIATFGIMFAGLLSVSIGSKRKMLAAYGISMLSILGADVMVLIIAAKLSPKLYATFVAEDTKVALALNLLMALCEFFIAAGIVLCLKRTTMRYAFEDYKFFVFLPMSQSLCVGLIYVALGKYDPSSTVILSVGMIFLFLMVDYVAFQAIEKLKEKRVLEERAIFFKEQMQAQLEQYEDFKEYNGVLKKLRHDMKNQMQTIQALIEQENYKAAKECAQHVLLETERMNHFNFCEHEMLNAVIFSKVKGISKGEDGIVFTHELCVPKDIKIEGLDLCRLFFNMMDNAVEGCRNATGEKSIHIVAKIIKEHLVIQCENSCSETLRTDVKTGEFISTKKEKGHGNGIPIMKEIVEKYEGTIGLEQKKNRFVLKAYLLLEA